MTPFQLISVVLALSATPALAQNQSLPELPQTTSADFEAVGRLGTLPFELKQGCSATLIAPDLVVTAGHCVSLSGQSNRVFAPGWRDWAVFGQIGTSVEIRHPAYAVDGQHRPQNDLALVILETLVVGIDPIPLAQKDDVGFEELQVALVGYHADRPDRLSGSFTCPVAPFDDGLWHVDCPVIHGNSGGPALEQSPDGEWEIVGIVSSQYRGGAIVVTIPDWLLREVDAHLAR